MGPNFLITEEIALLAIIDPDAYAADIYETAYIPMSAWENIAALISAGDFETGATLNAKLRQAQDSSGTGAKDITGKSITALTEAGSDGNKQAWINVRPEDLDINNGFTHVCLTVTTAVDAVDFSAHVFGKNPRFGLSDAASVDEIIT